MLYIHIYMYIYIFVINPGDHALTPEHIHTMSKKC